MLRALRVLRGSPNETAEMLAATLEDPERAELWAGIAAALSGE
jgi:hypothetical protein